MLLAPVVIGVVAGLCMSVMVLLLLRKSGYFKKQTKEAVLAATYEREAYQDKPPPLPVNPPLERRWGVLREIVDKDAVIAKPTPTSLASPEVMEDGRPPDDEDAEEPPAPAPPAPLAADLKPICFTEMGTRMEHEWPDRVLTVTVLERATSYAHQVHVWDTEGVEGALFFFIPGDDPAPYFDWRHLRPGATVVVAAPRLHRFLDGQTGLRIETAEVVRVVPADDTTSPAARLRLAQSLKAAGAAWYGRHRAPDPTTTALADAASAGARRRGEQPRSRELDSAYARYDGALRVLKQLFVRVAPDAVTEAEREAAVELAVAVLSNYALAALAARDFGLSKEMALKAARLAPASAKVQFRVGQAFEALDEFGPAVAAFRRASALEPADAALARRVVECEARGRDARMSQSALYRKMVGPDAAKAK